MRRLFEPLGDQGLLLRLTGDEITILCSRSREIASALGRLSVPGITDIVPAYASIAVYFDQAIISYQTMERTLNHLIETSTESGDSTQTGKVINVPVCYGGEFGPDLAEVADLHKITETELIRGHSEAAYTVAMVGFSPGFPYLLGLPEMLATPRRVTPRIKVPGGSVGIGGSQTGIYPQDSPGGWNIIGRTPIRLFRVQNTRPSLFLAGDRVKFVEIEAGRFDEIAVEENRDNVDEN